MPYRIYNTKAIILRNLPLGEADKSIVMFTQDLGLIKAQAKGVRYEKSKLSSKLQDATLSEVGLVRGKNSWRLTSAIEIKNYFRSLRTQKQKLDVFAKILNLILQFVHGEEKNSQLFDILIDAFDFLTDAKLSRSEISTYEALLVLRILHELGYVSEKDEFKAVLNLPWVRALSVAAGNKKVIISSINYALKESHLGV